MAHAEPNGSEIVARRAREGGFTLLELVVVLVILTTLAAVAAPRMVELLRGARVRAVTRELIAMARLAREQAVLRGEEVELRNDPGAREARLEVGDRGTSRTSGLIDVDRLFAPRKGGAGIAPALARRELPPGIRLFGADGAEGLRWVFRPDGTAEGGRSRIVGEEGREVAIEVDPITGRVRVAGAS